MRFIGMNPLAERAPNIEVTDGQRLFDLHNECILVDIELRVRESAIIVRFRSSKEVSGTDRSREATVVLELRPVLDLHLSGNPARQSLEGDPLGLDFIEYSAVEESGTLRFVLDDGSELTVSAKTCRMTVLEQLITDSSLLR